MWNQSCATSSTLVAWTAPTIIEGDGLADDDLGTAASGVTWSWSKVPCSRSRATDSAVSIMVWIKVSVPISAGIMFQRVSRLALYQARTIGCTAGGGRPCAARQSALKPARWC